MSIITKIKNSVEAATGLSFYYDTPQTLNYRLDRVTFPCAMMHIAQSGTITDQNGILHERLTISVIFATTSRLDFDGLSVEENEIDGLKQKAFLWLVSLKNNHDLRLISENGTERYYATDDAIFSAFAVNVTIEEISGVSKCDIPEPTTNG